jgi:hypothetical protein
MASRWITQSKAKPDILIQLTNRSTPTASEQDQGSGLNNQQNFANSSDQATLLENPITRSTNSR